MPEASGKLESGEGARHVNADSPWLGLLPFSRETQRFFFGRDAEIREIFLRVRDHPLTVLYGQSGYGKTSLLNAGLIPKLVVEGFRPVRLHLRFEKKDPPLIEQVRAALAAACAVETTQSEALLERWGKATLWECFHHHELCAQRLSAAPPVLIFDQFEELFAIGATQRPRGEIEALATQLSDLVENRTPASVQARLANDVDLANELEFNASPLRLIITLREDFLSHLEAWKDALPSLMRNRMALHLLRGPQALEAVVRPGRLDGRNLVSSEVGAQIVRVIARQPPGTPLKEIEAVPPLLSLLCDELNRARSGASSITSELVEQRHGDILQQFYARSFEGLPLEVRRFVEDRLVTVGGHRNLVAREDAEAELTRAGVPEAKAVLDKLLQRRLLSAEQRGGTQRVEITHDVLTPLVAASRDKRQERERAERAEAERRAAEEQARRAARQKRRLRRLAIAAAAAAVAAMLFAFWAQTKSRRLMQEKIVTMSQYIQLEAQLHESKSEKERAGVEEQVYAELGQRFNVDPKILREKLPGFAERLMRSPMASSYERANAAYVTKDYLEAERLALQAADDARKAGKSSETIQALELAGLSAQRHVEYARAMEHFHEAAKLTDRERHPKEWAEVQQAIADLLFDKGHFKESEDVSRAVIRVRYRVLGPEHPDSLRSRSSLAAALWRHGKYAEAEANFRDLIKLREKLGGPEHPDTLSSRHGLAIVLHMQGRYAEAEAENRSILALREKVLGPEHPDTLNSRNNLAAALNSQGKHVEAEAEFRKLIKIQEKVLGPDHPDTLGSRNELAVALLDEGKYVEAEGQERDVIKLRRKVLGLEHPDTLLSRDAFASALAGQGKYAEAEAEYGAVIRIQTKLLGSDHPDTLDSRSHLARTLMAEGKDDSAEMRQVIQLREKVNGPEHPDTLESCYDFACGLETQGKIQEAKEFARRAVEGARKILGPDHPSTKKYEKLVADLERKPRPELD